MTSPAAAIVQDATPAEGKHYNPGLSPNVVVVAVVVLVLAVIAAIVGASFSGNGSSTPVLTTLLGFVGPIVVGLVTLLKVDKAGQQTSALTNGLLDTKVQNAVRAVLNEAQTAVTGNRPGNTLFTPAGDGPNATTVIPVVPVQPPAPPSAPHGG